MANLDLIGELMIREHRPNFKVLHQPVMKTLGAALNGFTFKDPGPVSGRPGWYARRSAGELLILEGTALRLDVLLPPGSMVVVDSQMRMVTVKMKGPALRAWVSFRDDIETNNEVSY